MAATVPAMASAVEPTFLHGLSTTTGFIPSNGVQLYVDDENHEVFTIGEGLVRVFNQAGMEVYSFGLDREIGGIISISPFLDGDLLVLSYQEGAFRLVRCNFRGEFVSRIELTGLPAEDAGFIPGRMRFAHGRIYLVDTCAMKVVLADPAGKVEKVFDVAKLLDVVDKRQDTGLRGFNVDTDGSILLTCQPLFKAYVLTLDGTLKPFGQRGNGPGRFNVISGIASDERYLYVTDLLKSVVLVFNRDLKFVTEFGYRGDDPSSLNSPTDIAAAGGQVYVSQYARKGVSVFKMEEPSS
jgi:hypothetical protein